MWTNDQLFENAYSLMCDSLSIGHLGATQSLDMNISWVTGIVNGQVPTFRTDCEFALPMSVTPIGVAVPDPEHVEFVQRFQDN